MSGRDFGTALDLYWPTLLPPVGQDDRSILVYFGTYVQGDRETWALVSVPVTDIASATCFVHGTRAHVVGLSKTVRGVTFVYATAISQVVGVDGCSRPQRPLPKLLWPFIVFGSPVVDTGAALLKSPLSLEGVAVNRRAEVHGAPVVVRFKVDTSSPHLSAMLPHGTTGTVKAAGVLESLSAGQVRIRVNRLDLTFCSNDGASGPRDPQRKLKGVSLVWYWAALFVKSQAERIKRSVMGESVSLSVLRELYSVPGADLTALVLSFSLSRGSKC